MRHKVLRYSSILASAAFVTVFFGAAILNTPESGAVSATDFNAGNIIDDGVFYNKNTMTVAEIQAHLNRYMPACDTWGTGAVGSGRYINGRAVPANTTRAEYARQMRAAGKSRYHDPPYVCVQNYYENPTTHETLYDTKNVVKSGMISAAQIIYNAAQKYGVNPQVLLVLLKKESYVWGDNWPLKDEYNTVMGYACPDTAPCDSKYFGFYNQVEMAAWQLNYYKEHIYSYNYRPYATNSILYSPDASCGRKSVYLENIATTSLYIYTPYTPNDAALRNYPGTATCGSYGNRNFFMYFSEWFGSTHGVTGAKRVVPDGTYKITTTDGSKTLHVSGDSKTNSANYVMDAASSASTAFSFKRNSDNSYTIINTGTNKAIDVPGAGATVGAEIKTWDSNGTNAQKWFVYSNDNGVYLASLLNPSYVLSINDSGKLVLDVFGSQSSKPMKFNITANEKINGDYNIETKLKSGVVLDLAGNSSAEGANATVYAANGTSAQDFKISYDDKTGYHKIANGYGKVLTISGNIKDGANLQFNADNGSCGQRFAIFKVGSDYVFYSSCNIGFVVDVAGGSSDNGTNVWIYSGNNSNAQRWTLKKKQAAATTPAKSTPTTNTQLIADGNYTISSALKSNYVLDVAGAGKADGTNIAMWTKNGTAAQTFTVKYNSSKDAYLITNPNSGKAIDLVGGVAKDGTNINIYAINNSCAQLWKIKKSGNYYSIISTCSEKFVLDVAGAGTANGTNVWVYSNNNSKAQQWSFDKVETASTPAKSTPATTTNQVIADGNYTIGTALKSGFVMDVAGAGKADGTNIAMWTKNNTVAQTFAVKYNASKDAYMISNPNSGKVLDLAGAGTKDGNNVWIYGSNNSCAQLWKIKKNGNYYKIASACNEKYVLDIAGAGSANGTNVWVYSDNGTKAQQWSFEKR